MLCEAGGGGSGDESVVSLTLAVSSAGPPRGQLYWPTRACCYGYACHCGTGVLAGRLRQGGLEELALRVVRSCGLQRRPVRKRARQRPTGSRPQIHPPRCDLVLVMVAVRSVGRSSSPTLTER